jgi:3-deoxy-D-manno-octulosonate 8-phosphate phosphatase (KDO 8-P phosphatase)
MVKTPTASLLENVRLVAMDVDGVLTNGDVVWGVDEAGEMLELKKFSVRDGLAISLIRTLGYEVAWITGRTSAIVEKRAAELGVREVHQRSRNKHAVLTGVMERLRLGREQVLYIGDDLNDLPAFDAAGVRVTVADAPADIQDRADWITQAAGGAGAVREVIETLLRSQGRWEEGVDAFLARLRTEQSQPLQ